MKAGMWKQLYYRPIYTIFTVYKNTISESKFKKPGETHQLIY